MVGRIIGTNPVSQAAINEYCELANRISTRIRYNYKPIHGLNRWNDSVAHLPPTYDFTIAFPAVSKSTRLLNVFLSAGLPFTFEVADYNNSGEYALLGEKFLECRVTERRVNIVVDDVPSVVFSGMALRHDPEFMDADGVNQGSLNQFFGNGAALSEETAIKLFAEWTGAQVSA